MDQICDTNLSKEPLRVQNWSIRSNNDPKFVFMNYAPFRPMHDSFTWKFKLWHKLNQHHQKSIIGDGSYNFD